MVHVSTLWGQSTFLTCMLIPHLDVTGNKPSAWSLWMRKPAMKASNGHVL